MYRKHVKYMLIEAPSFC